MNSKKKLECKFNFYHEENIMHKIFGIKESKEYVDHEGAYIIPIKDGQVSYFHPIQTYYSASLT